MKKIKSWVSQNIFFIFTLALLALIPLYPKLPLVDIKNTWVYIRAEDFIVLLVLFVFSIYFIRKKVSLNTPLTLPIIIFWIIGGIATIHGVLLIFPTIANVFPNVAFLSYMRHIEYFSLFFIAYAAMKEKDFLKIIVGVLAFVFVSACLYGLGQKYASFPAFLTMNEEFAKGIPIQLSALSRVPSTFAGHYDFAAYLVLMIPIFASLFFGVKNWMIKIFFAALIPLGFLLMFMTVSRVSFAVVFVALLVVLFLQKRKLVLFTVPLLVCLVFIFIFFQSNLFLRFGNTVQKVDVLVNGKTGAAVGNIEYVPVSYFYDKNVKLQRVDDDEVIVNAMQGEIKESTSSALLPPYMYLEPDTKVPLVRASNISTGETLPQGTGYINLSLSPVTSRVGDFFYELSPDIPGDIDAVNFHGNFIVKNASAYDLSFTTRFQGEWPHAITAFMRNIFFGSGYGSVSLAMDNNFLRMLAEIGLLGTAAFFGIFIVFGIYIRKNYSSVESKFVKSFVIGVCAGLFGLFLNATLIDVFEASKIAFTMWLLIGVTVGIVSLYSKKSISMVYELRSAATSVYAVIIYYGLFSIFLFSPMINTFFALQDFTVFFNALRNPINSDAFFSYNPLSNMYFAGMYKIFWFNQIAYHIVSVLCNFIVSVLIFLIAQKITKNRYVASMSGFVFLISSGYIHTVLSVADTGVILSAVCSLGSLLLFMHWTEKKKVLFYIGTLILLFISILFSEMGFATPGLFIAYLLTKPQTSKRQLVSFPMIIFLIPYLIIFLANLAIVASNVSFHALINMPYHVFVQGLEYFFATFIGDYALKISSVSLAIPPLLQIAFSAFVIFLLVLSIIKRSIFKKYIHKFHVQHYAFPIIAFVLVALPFLFTMNNSFKYGYLASSGVVIFCALIIYRLYQYLLTNGKQIALGIISVIVIIFSLFNIIQIQNIFANDKTANDKVNNFLISIDGLYDNAWASNKTTFYVVNVPDEFRKNEGSAMEALLWFSFANSELNVVHVDSLDDAYILNGNNNLNKIFIFEDDGRVKEAPRRQQAL